MGHVDQGMVKTQKSPAEPSIYEGDRKSLVMVYTSAAKLFCITDGARLLIIPDIFSYYTQNKHTKYEQGGEPDLSNHSGVDVNFLQNASKETPVLRVYLVRHLSSEPHQLGGR